MDEEWKALSNVRLDKSMQCLKSARVLISIDDYKGAANRSYYSIFHAMRSVLALEGKDFVKHSGVISYFRKEYIKTGIFSRELSTIITKAFSVRSNSDYEDYYVISKEEVEVQVSNAEIFYREISEYCKSKF